MSKEGEWVSVPRYLTPEMHEAAVRLDLTSTHDPLWPEYWEAILAAAPKRYHTYQAIDEGTDDKSLLAS